MSKQSAISKMVASDKNKGLISCSTPENRADSPSRDSDSPCDSDAGSPVPFLCTQDGAEGETDVVWNFYTPKSERTTKIQPKNSTPLSRKCKKSLRPKLIEKQMPKRRALRSTQKNTELFQELLELNQNLQELIPKKPQNHLEKHHSGSEDDIFNDSPEYSPKSARRSSSNCLRRNVLSCNFSKPDTENALESDDSMNECLLKASQIVEGILDSKATSPKQTCYEINESKTKSDFKLNQDSMDAILSNVRLQSPLLSKVKKCNSPHLNDDSFDSLVGNLNDSLLEQLTQIPVKKDFSSKSTDWKVKELVVHDGSPSSKSFCRHTSMPESPSFTDINKPSTSGMVFGRYSSMPYERNTGNTIALEDSPIRCTPEEIKKKHQQAREKLLAKRLFPFTSSQQLNEPGIPTQLTENKNTKFQAEVPSSSNEVKNNVPVKTVKFEVKKSSNATDIRLLLEKKRQEALLKLRRRQPHNKIP